MRTYKNDKKLMEMIAEAKRWKKLDQMCYFIEVDAIVTYLCETYDLNKDDAKSVFDELMK